MANSLVGYAVLRANYNANAGSYLDNFSGFVLSTLAEVHPRYLQKEQIAESIRREYGIAIPDLVVGRLLRRTRRRGLADEVAKDCFSASSAGLEQAPAIREMSSRYRAQQTELESEFRHFVENAYPEHAGLLQQDVGTALHSYFERHAVPLLSRSLQGSPLTVQSGVGFDYLISRFVAELSASDQARFQYVVDASKGAILAAVLELDTSGFSDSLHGLSLYFDTPIVINALGFQGDLLQRAALQVIDIAKSQGARLCVFAHSVKELRGILGGVESSLRAGGRSQSTSAVYLHFAETGQSAVDVLEIGSRLEESLEALGLRVVDKPSNYAAFGLDEAGLEKHLQDVVHYREASTRVYDVDSLAAVHRLREGLSPERFERAKAIFITSNSALVRAARDYVGTKRGRDQFPLALHEGAAAALLWVRSAAMEDDVPREQLLATAYAGMQPSPALWSRYLKEIDQLEARDAVTAEEAVILRSTSVGRSALMDETLGEGGELSDELPLQVLERVRSGIESPFQGTIEELESAREKAVLAAATLATESAEQKRARTAAEDQMRALVERLEKQEQENSEFRSRQLSALDRRVAKSVRVWSRTFVAASFVLVIVLAFVIAYSSIQGKSSFPGWLVAAVMAALAVVAIVPLFFPGSVLEWLRPLEERCIANFQRRRRLSLGYDDAPSESTVR